jgi:hypothetical protein
MPWLFFRERLLTSRIDTLTALGSTSETEGSAKNHAFLYFRCAVRRASDLFRLGRPVSKNAASRLTRIFREMSPADGPQEAAERLFSVYGRLLTPSQALDQGILARHEGWFNRTVRGMAEEADSVHVWADSEPEEQCEFLYLPGLRRCYTLVWRWLPVMSVGGPGFSGPIRLEDCNRLQGILRADFGLEPGTLLEVYPGWVEPRKVESLWARHKDEVQATTAWNYRFKPWEESPA